MDAAGIEFPVPEIDAIEHMFLELYLALVLMTIDITKLAPVAGQMGIILLAQAILMALFAIFVSFNLFGRDYGAAVMAAGNCGWGCGSGPNAVANEKAVMDQYGWHTKPLWISMDGTPLLGFYIRPSQLSSTIFTTRFSFPSSPA